MRKRKFKMFARFVLRHALMTVVLACAAVFLIMILEASIVPTDGRQAWWHGFGRENSILLGIVACTVGLLNMIRLWRRKTVTVWEALDRHAKLRCPHCQDILKTFGNSTWDCPQCGLRCLSSFSKHPLTGGDLQILTSRRA